MKHWRILGFSLALTLAIAVVPAEAPRAQEGIDWSDESVFTSHPEIIHEVFTHYGFSVNDDEYGFAYRQTTDRECYFSEEGESVSGVDENFMHFDYDRILSGLNSEFFTVVEAKDYYWEGIHIVTYKTRSADRFHVGERSEAFIDLFGSNRYVYWEVESHCAKKYGNPLPEISDLVNVFLSTIKGYGFRTPAELSTSALEPSPTPMVYIAPDDPDALAAGDSELTDEELEQLLAYDPSQMDPSQLPAMAGAAAIGAALGAVLMQLLASMSSTQPPPAPVHFSPATGKPATLEQVLQEQALMDSGHVYRDGEWHAPKGEYSAGPSILSEEYLREKAVRDAARQAQWAKEDELRRKQVAAFDKLMELERQQLQAKHDLVRANAKYYLVKGVEWAADIGFSVAARAAGPIAGPAAKQMYEKLKQLAGGLSTIYFEGGEKAVENLLVDKLTPKLPGLETEGAGLVRSVGEELFNKAAEEGAKGVVEDLVEGLPGKGVELITGTPGI